MKTLGKNVKLWFNENSVNRNFFIVILLVTMFWKWEKALLHFCGNSQYITFFIWCDFFSYKYLSACL